MDEWQHIIPLNDLIEHTTDFNGPGCCACDPRIDVENMSVVHESLDSKEVFETAREGEGEPVKKAPGLNELIDYCRNRLRSTRIGGDIMLDEFIHQNVSDPDGNPSGGTVSGCGLEIRWQNGPLGRGLERRAPNGAFVETVIDAARQRLEFYQASKFNCRENAIAITKLEEALMWLNKRTADREKRQVEGEHKV